MSDERVTPPPIEPRFHYAYEAFNRLATQRHFGETGPQYIRLEAVLAYADLVGIDDREDREDFVFLIEAMDRAYIAELAEKRERESRRKSKPSSKPPGRR